MKFRTEYHPVPSLKVRLDPERPIVLLGSCFSDNIGSLMRASLWDARVNPCGTLFNPESIARTVGMALGTEKFSSCSTDGQLWSNWDFPTTFSRLTAGECDSACRGALATLAASLRKAQALVVTFGTARVYQLAEEPGRIVANCHKQPSALFAVRRLDADAIVERWRKVVVALRAVNPGLSVIFTVSPVRHVRDGFAENARSKATLLLAAERLAALDGCDYFPAFEILTDDLRDYRFYGPDLVHPTAEAAEYIFDIFQQTYIPAAGQALLREGRDLLRSFMHRPLIAGSPQGEAFLRAREMRRQSWINQHPSMTDPLDYEK